MIGRDVTVHSTDPLSGETVTAVSSDGKWTSDPTTAVVFVGSNGSSGDGVTESCCPVINFFSNADNARAYQRRRRLEGDAMSVAEAAQAGALVFGQLLGEPSGLIPPPEPRTSPSTRRDEGTSTTGSSGYASA